MTDPAATLSRAELATRLRTAARLEGRFTLRSGRTTTTYFDKYRFEADPALLAAVTAHLVPLVPADTEVLAGLELGGVPVATALSLATGLPAAFVRKHAKDYGTARLAEGADIDGRRVLVVEDVVTSGGQVMRSTTGLRDLGADIASALCVVDREQGGPEALGADSVELLALFAGAELDV